MAKEAVSYIEYLLTQEKLGKRDRSRLEAALGELQGGPKVEEVGDKDTRDTSHGLLLEAVQDYESNPHNPEMITKAFQKIWSPRRSKLEDARVIIGLVPPCSYTEEELKVLESEGRRVGYLSKDLAAQEDRHFLAILWPEMGSYSVQKGNPVTNEADRYGWFDYEISVDAPYRDTTEDQLRKEFKKQKREGLTLNQYIVAGQDSKLLTGHYLDEVSTRARLLGSRYGGHVVHAHFYEGGRLRVGRYLSPQDHAPDLGGRSAGVPQKSLKL